MSVSGSSCAPLPQVRWVQRPARSGGPGSAPAHCPLAQSLPAWHRPPTSHAGHSPPQSTSVSVPFGMASVQLGTAHDPSSQTPLSQSAAREQDAPEPQRGQFPPQSTSVSSPLRSPSRQWAGAQTPGSEGRARWQTPLRQSAWASQPRPSWQPGHPPPQSTEVSAPFRTVSVQEGAAQTPPSQTPLTQSSARVQPSASGQGAHGPPQSIPVSASPGRPSPQAAGRQRPSWQNPERQS